ncbi:MAG: hypothetical protein AAF804_20410 [Bacteroidota bacterium]
MKLKNYLKYFVRIYALIGIFYLTISLIQSIWTGGENLTEILSKTFFATLMVGTGLALAQIFAVKKLRKGKVNEEDLEVERDREMVIEADGDQLFDALEAELLQKKWKPKHLNRMAGYQEWITPWWDDSQSKVKVYLENLSPGHLKVTLTSKPRHEMNFVDKGKNIKNLDKLEAFIMSLIEEKPEDNEFNPNLELN